MTGVKVIRDQDPAETVDDYVRVSCREAADGTATTIERVLLRADDSGQWKLRRLFKGCCPSADAAVALATAYAEHKGIPVVYTEVEQT
jgi:hypothetical protein